jgi:hypothetical protein
MSEPSFGCFYMKLRVIFNRREVHYHAAGAVVALENEDDMNETVVSSSLKARMDLG